MPIKPENKKLYPKNWKAIRAEILERARGHPGSSMRPACEMCHVIDGWVYHRHKNGAPFFPDLCPSIDTPLSKGYRRVKIVLTIAHLNHNPRDNRRSNLKALCQQCHLRHDAKHHAKTARETRERKSKEAGQGWMFE